MSILAVLALSLSLSAAAGARPAAVCKPQVAAKKIVLAFPDGATIKADVADSPATRETGLMCRTKLPKDYGMLFVFPAERNVGFWMKNTLVCLDLVWIGAVKKVTVVAPRLKASTVDTPEDKVARAGGRGQYVLELPAGAAKRHGLKAGDTLDFEVAIPPR